MMANAGSANKPLPDCESAASRGGMPLKNACVALIGVDIGGTFTDLCRWDGQELRSFKLLSTPPDYQKAVIEGVRHLGPTGGFHCIQGSTVATNGLLERKGRRTAFVATQGFRDLLLIGRQNRPRLYDFDFVRPAAVVQPTDCFEVPERLDAAGQVVEPLDEAAACAVLDQIAAKGIQDLAVCLLFGFLDSAHERRVGELAAERGLRVSLSSRVAPEFREFERASTTAVNAYVGPLVAGYLSSLHRDLQDLGMGRLRVMQSNGGQISWQVAGEHAVRTILSGPAGGVVAGQAIARQAGIGRVVTYDMGGTSTDVALCSPRPEVTTEAIVDGWPIRAPMLAIHTLGAGGGSIARLDAGGALKVGPESAGANPGPACYGRGCEPTVTDAHVVLGRIVPEWFLGGRMRIDADRSRIAVGRLAEQMACSLEDAALGIAGVANANMDRAIKAVSAQRGHDPRDYWLVSFGGAGGLHACELAASLNMAGVLVPMQPGILSAMGMLLADWIRDFGLSIPPVAQSRKDPGGNDPGLDRIHAGYGQLAAEALDAAQRDGYKPEQCILERLADMRYVGQSHELTVPVASTGSLAELARPFHGLHQQRYGHQRPDEPVEVVTLRVTATVPTSKPHLPRLSLGRSDASAAIIKRMQVFAEGFVRAPVCDRSKLLAGNRLTGPALVVEPHATTYLPPRWQMEVDLFGNMLLRF